MCLCISPALRQTLRGAVVCVCLVCEAVVKRPTGAHSLPSWGSFKDPWRYFQIMLQAEQTVCNNLLFALQSLLPVSQRSYDCPWCLFSAWPGLPAPLPSCPAWVSAPTCLANSNWHADHLSVFSQDVFPDQWDVFTSPEVIPPPLSSGITWLF